MKNEYSKGKNYQAATNKPDTRNPNAPTQGGFSTPGGGQGQTKNNPKNPQTNRPTQPNKSGWGTGSINNDDNRGRTK